MLCDRAPIVYTLLRNIPEIIQSFIVYLRKIRTRDLSVVLIYVK